MFKNLQHSPHNFHQFVISLFKAKISCIFVHIYTCGSKSKWTRFCFGAKADFLRDCKREKNASLSSFGMTVFSSSNICRRHTKKKNILFSQNISIGHVGITISYAHILPKPDMLHFNTCENPFRDFVTVQTSLTDSHFERQLSRLIWLTIQSSSSLKSRLMYFAVPIACKERKAYSYLVT